MKSLGPTIPKLLTMIFGLISYSNVYSGQIYSFDISDVSWAEEVTGDFSNSVVTFEFASTANLNALADSDVLSMSWSNSVGAATASSGIGKLNINELFSISGGIAALTVGYTGTNAGIYAFGDGGNFLQIGQTTWHNIYESGPGGNNSAHSWINTHTYFSSGSISQDVPEPPVTALLLLALAGLLSIDRFNRSPTYYH